MQGGGAGPMHPGGVMPPPHAHPHPHDTDSGSDGGEEHGGHSGASPAGGWTADELTALPLHVAWPPPPSTDPATFGMLPPEPNGTSDNGDLRDYAAMARAGGVQNIAALGPQLTPRQITAQGQQFKFPPTHHTTCMHSQLIRMQQTRRK